MGVAARVVVPAGALAIRRAAVAVLVNVKTVKRVRCQAFDIGNDLNLLTKLKEADRTRGRGV